jgi:DNA-binding CsgD family transcriptional regulator
VAELADTLYRSEPGVSARELLASPLMELLRATRGGSYSLTAGDDQIRVSRIQAVGLLANEYARDLERFMARDPGEVLFYDPSRPEPKQRNIVTHLKPEQYTKHGQALYARHGLTESWQLRFLACDGPSLLAWVGVLRPEPFTSREHALLKALVPSVRHRLWLERRIGEAALPLSALPAVLEAAGAPALVLRGSGQVVLANASARSLLERDRGALHATLLGEIATRGPGRFAVTPLVLPGHPTYFLCIERPRPPDPTARCAAFAARHALSGRQADVLGLVVRGLDNKTIAAHLRCAESTVEMHLTAVYDRTQVESRAELVARFWAGRS